jgi:hypothetical protein
MYVLYGQAELFLPQSSSLKDKRQTIQSIIARIRKRFSVSICEVAYHDFWQRSTLGFAVACSSYADVNIITSAIRDTLEQYEDACEVTDFRTETVKPE